jgi:DNA-binding transcriptional LysR family regulator
MNEKDWVILQTIYEEKNITKSAERLFISQPALTYRLQQIEEELSITIFTRSNKGIHLTKEGEYLVKYAKKMIINFRHLKDQLMDYKQTATGELRIGASSNFAHYKLPAILKEFLHYYPNVQIKVTTGWSKKIMKLFHNEEIHIGIIRGENNWKGPGYLIDQDYLSLISKELLKLEDLPTLPMISYQTDPALEQLIDRWWRDKFSQPPFVSMEVDKLETCKEMVLKGLGYGIVPSYILENNPENLFIKNLKTPENNYIVRNLWMLYREKEIHLTVVKAFVDFMEKYRLYD